MLACDIAQFNGDASYWHMNVTDEFQVREVMESVKNRFGPITVLVNCAAVFGQRPTCRPGADDEWFRLMATNVCGVYYCSKYALLQMAQAGTGSIINVAPSEEIVGAPNVSSLIAFRNAKRAVLSVEESSNAFRKIRFNSICLGNIETDHYGIPEQPTKHWENLSDWISNRTMDSLEDLAQGVLYLASDESHQMMRNELIIDDRYAGRRS